MEAVNFLQRQSKSLVPVRDEDGQIVYETRSVAVTDGRAFRHDFYGAFTSRIRAKLWGAKRQAMDDAGVVAEDESSSVALALRDKAAEVEAAHAGQRARVKFLGNYEGSDTGRSSYDSTGVARELGVKAAEATSVHGERGVTNRKDMLGS